VGWGAFYVEQLDKLLSGSAIKFLAAECLVGVRISIRCFEAGLHEVEILLLAEGMGARGVSLIELRRGDSSLGCLLLAESPVVVDIELLETSFSRRPDLLSAQGLISAWVGVELMNDLCSGGIGLCEDRPAHINQPHEGDGR
jgi:hypothetical protein